MQAEGNLVGGKCVVWGKKRKNVKGLKIQQKIKCAQKLKK
jgi:hypothetical protein